MPIRPLAAPPRTADLVVIGGGIVGAATAFHSARAGMDVVLVEKRPALCSLTTAAAAGGFRLQLDDEEEMRLIGESVRLFLAFEDVTGQAEYDAGVRRQGYLWVTTSESRAEEQRALVEEQRGWGLEDVEILDGEAARGAFPFLDPAVLQARFRAGDGLIDPKSLTLGLALGSGARIVLGCAVTGFRVEAGRLSAVETELGYIATRSAVICAGPLSGLVAAMAGERLRVETVVRHKLVVPGLAAVPQEAPMTIDDDTGAHWRPALGGAYLLFTDPATPPSAPAETFAPDPGFAFRLLDPRSPTAVARVAPFWGEVWEHGGAHWMLQSGQYTMTPDRRPLIGELETEGIFVNTGYSGRGVMGGPAGSRILADLVGGRLDPVENPFRPDREFVERPRMDPL